MEERGEFPFVDVVHYSLEKLKKHIEACPNAHRKTGPQKLPNWPGLSLGLQ